MQKRVPEIDTSGKFHGADVRWIWPRAVPTKDIVCLKSAHTWIECGWIPVGQVFGAGHALRALEVGTVGRRLKTWTCR